MSHEGATDTAEGRAATRDNPINEEAPRSSLRAELTSTARHYVRNHFPLPRDDPRLRDAWRLETVTSGGDTASVSMKDLGVMPQRTVTVTMECAGNDRGAIRPTTLGRQWGMGAISTAAWSGVSLRDVIKRFGLDRDAQELIVTGADSGHPEEAEGPLNFARALPLWKACDPDVILATLMNGQPIPHIHGAPVRLVVPGWYGMANVKWVVRLASTREPFEGWFQKDRYVYDSRVAGGERQPVTTMRVKSLVTTPAFAATVPRGYLIVRGWAWSGGFPIERVDISVDDSPWKPCSLSPSTSPVMWRGFSARVYVAAPGTHLLRTRARDATGAEQPSTPEWNAHGYGNNAVSTHSFRAV